MISRTALMLVLLAAAAASAQQPNLEDLERRYMEAQKAQAEKQERERREAERRKGATGTVFRDCPQCPEIVVVPAGQFTMGSPAGEAGRYDNEGPQRLVTIGSYFAIGKFEVTRGQYAAFARETGRPALGDCWYHSPSEGKPVNDDPVRNWSNPGFDQGEDHPVVCVTWNDAKAFAQWLSRKTGRDYRLPTEAQWEHAARAGRSGARPWGDNPNDACAHANVQDQTMARVVPAGPGRSWGNAHRCDDGSAYSSPVGRYRTTASGCTDMIGNVNEWVEDCWNDSYDGAPIDGSAWESGNCARRVNRGGGWNFGPRDARSARRYWRGTANRNNSLGFRLARTL